MRFSTVVNIFKQVRTLPYTAGGERVRLILAKVVGIICSNEGPAQTANGKGTTRGGTREETANV